MAMLYLKQYCSVLKQLPTIYKLRRLLLASVVEQAGLSLNLNSLSSQCASGKLSLA